MYACKSVPNSEKYLPVAKGCVRGWLQVHASDHFTTWQFVVIGFAPFSNGVYSHQAHGHEQIEADI